MAIKFVVMLLAVAGLCRAQDAATTDQKCALEGHVVNSVTGEAVRKASVVILPVGGGKLESGGTTVSDAQGRFTFAGLAPGTYRVVASHASYVDRNLSPRERLQKSGPTVVTLQAGDQKSGFDVRLIPMGAVSGRVVDEDGDPISRVQMELMAYRYAPGGRELDTWRQASTDDRGNFRFFDLEPGSYYMKVSGSEPSAEGLSYARLFYPGALTAASATALEVKPGQETAGADMVLRKMKLATLRGKVIAPEGATDVSISVEHYTEGSSSSEQEQVDDASGKFSFSNREPGSFFLVGRATVGEKTYSAVVPVEVGSTDIDGLELHVAPPMQITGRMGIEGTTDTKLVELQPLLLGHAKNQEENRARVNADGTFVFKDVPADTYRVMIQLSEPLYFKSARLGSTDVTDAAIDLTEGVAPGELNIVLSANSAQVDGIVQDENEQPVAGATVALVPDSLEKRKSRFEIVIADEKGHFRFAPLGPGGYSLFAFDDVDPGALRYDPDFLKPYEAKAKSLRLQEKAKETVTLTVIGTNK